MSTNRTAARMRRGGIIFITATPVPGPAWIYHHIITHRGDDHGQRDYIHATVKANCRDARSAWNTQARTSCVWWGVRRGRQAGARKFQHLTGMVFKQFHKRVHVIKPLHINKRDSPVWEAIDPHPRDPDALLWLAVDAKGRKFVVDELYTADYFNGAWKPYRLTNAALVQRIKRGLQDRETHRRPLAVSIGHVTRSHWFANLFITAPLFGQPYVDAVYWSLVIEVVFYGWVALFMMVGLVSSPH